MIGRTKLLLGLTLIASLCTVSNLASANQYTQYMQGPDAIYGGDSGQSGPHSTITFIIKIFPY